MCWKRERPRLPTPRGRVGFWHDLGRLCWTYLRRKVDSNERRILYDSLACDSVLGQLPHATVASISRRSDFVRATHEPHYMATLKAVPGYVPACGFTAPDALVPLHGGKDLVVRLNTNGPFNPSEFEGIDGRFDLTSLCQAATVRGCKVLFPCQWYGSLCHGCALGVLATLESSDIPRGPRPHVIRQAVLRSMGGQVGTYADFWQHAHDKQVEKVMNHLWEKVHAVPDFAAQFPIAYMQPTVNVNAAVMWLFADTSVVPSYVRITE